VEDAAKRVQPEIGGPHAGRADGSKGHRGR
jgi:hypothetical protein